MLKKFLAKTTIRLSFLEIIILTSIIISVSSFVYFVYNFYQLNGNLELLPGQVTKSVDIYEIELDIVTQLKDMQAYTMTGDEADLLVFQKDTTELDVECNYSG